MTSHRYRKPGVRGTTRTPQGRYVTQARMTKHDWVNVGTFDTPERASLAVRLFEHWVARGHDPYAVPRQPRTRDAI